MVSAVFMKLTSSSNCIYFVLFFNGTSKNIRSCANWWTKMQKKHPGESCHGGEGSIFRRRHVAFLSPPCLVSSSNQLIKQWHPRWWKEALMSALNFIPPSRAGASAIKMDRWQKEEGGEGGRRRWRKSRRRKRRRTAVSGSSESAALFREAPGLPGRRETRPRRCTDMRFFLSPSLITIDI